MGIFGYDGMSAFGLEVALDSVNKNSERRAESRQDAAVEEVRHNLSVVRLKLAKTEGMLAEANRRIAYLEEKLIEKHGWSDNWETEEKKALWPKDINWGSM